MATDENKPNKPHHRKPYHESQTYGIPTADKFHRRRTTPGPGPSSGIPKKDLELSKIEKQVANIRAILNRDRVQATLTAADIKTELSKIEQSTRILKG